jgi:hypothetical protein
VGPGREGVRQLGQEQAHRRGRELGHGERDARVALGAHGPEQVGRGEALLMKAARTHALLGPDVGEAALLADPGLVHEPELDAPCLRVVGRDRVDQGRQAFLNRSCAFGSAPGWTGRAFCQERSRPLSSLSMPVSL